MNGKTLKERLSDEKASQKMLRSSLCFFVVTNIYKGMGGEFFAIFCQNKSALQ